MEDSYDNFGKSEIGPYKLLGIIGEGSFSFVRLAKNTSNEKLYACKIIPRSRLNNYALVERFEAEIRVSQQMHHPNIVELNDLYRDDDFFYVFMEWCPNGELFQFIVDRGYVPEFQAKIIMKQILNALIYVHKMGVAHRDIKPENFLIDRFGHIKLGDFGLSRFCSSNGLVNTPCGSPVYASPECISGNPYNGKMSDVWSLGVLLFAMLTGQLPWSKKNQSQLFEQISTGDYQIPEDLSSDAKDLIRSMMCVNIEKRIKLEDAINHKWLQGVPDLPELPTPPGISIRKVDEFFNYKRDTDLDIPTEIKMGKSVKLITFNQTSRFIRSKVPPKMHSVSVQSDKYQKQKTSVFPAIKKPRIRRTYHTAPHQLMSFDLK